MTHKFYQSLLLLCLFLAPACTRPYAPLGKPVPSFSYNHLGEMRAHNGAVRVERSNVQSAHKNKDFIGNPYEVLSSYADHRFDQNLELPLRLIFNIQRANLIKTLPEQNMFERLTFQDREQYQLLIDIEMTPVSQQGELQKPYTIEMDRVLQLSENISLSQKEFRQFEFLEKAMTDIDRAVVDILTNRLK